MAHIGVHLVTMGLKPESIKRLLDDIRLLSLPPKKKREIIIRTLRRMKDITKHNASNQQEPTGIAWKPRKVGSYKMLRKIAKKLNTQGEAGKGKLFYSNEITSRIAAEHQYGIPNEFKPGKFTGGSESGKKPCTPKQAKKLRDLGYMIPSGKKKKVGSKLRAKFKKASLKEIQEKLTVDQAGVIIRSMTTEGPSKKLRKWIIPTVRRPFLDERTEENAKIMTEIIDQFMQENR